MITTQFPTYLSHYFEKKDGPFKSMTDDGLETSKIIFDQLKESGKSVKSNFPNEYVPLRNSVEDWLLKDYQLKGGRPKRTNPIYTVLGNCDWLLSWYENGEVVKIPLTDINPNQASFTYCDSMISYQHKFQQELVEALKGKYEMMDYYGQVYLFSELEEVVSKFGWPKGKVINGRPQSPDLYIEVQLWEDLI